MIFQEQQQFKLAWVNRVLIILMLAFSALLVFSIIKGSANAPFIVGAGIILLLYLIFNKATLHTKYGKEGITYYFFPFTL